MFNFGAKNITSQKWPHGGSSQSVAYLQRCAMTMKLTGTDGQTGGQTDHVLSQADALIKNVA